MAGDSIERYVVSYPNREEDKLYRWGVWAAEKGVLDEYLMVLKTIHYRLTCEPMEWGEPRYTLHHLKLEMRFGTFKMLNVRGACCSGRHIAIRRACVHFDGDIISGRIAGGARELRPSR